MSPWAAASLGGERHRLVLGSAIDNQGVAIPASNLTWRLVLKHGLCPDCHDHFLQTYNGVASGSFTARDHDYPSELELSLTATAACGLRGLGTRPAGSERSSSPTNSV